MFASAAFDFAFLGFRRAHTLMGDLRVAARSSRPIAFEERLATLSASTNREIQKAVREVPLGLQTYFARISEDFTSNPVNYSALVTRILSRGIKVAFASLNYDSLLEQAIAGLHGLHHHSEHFSYVGPEGKWLIAKLHGSVDWGYPWPQAERFSSTAEALEKLGPPEQRSFSIKLPKELRTDGAVYFPAIALPVAGKYGFICSRDMQNQLAGYVRASEALLFAGFSGQDKDLLDFLQEHLADSAAPWVDVVSVEDAEDVATRILSGVPKLDNSRAGSRIGLRRQGFAKYVEEDLDDFLDRMTL